MQLLLGLLYQSIAVVGPGKICPETKVDRFYPFTIYNEKEVDLSEPSEVYYEFFCFKDAQLQVIF